MPWLHWPRDEPRQTFPTCLTCSLNLAEAGFILIGGGWQPHGGRVAGVAGAAGGQPRLGGAVPGEQPEPQHRAGGRAHAAPPSRPQGAERPGQQQL